MHSLRMDLPLHLHFHSATQHANTPAYAAKNFWKFAIILGNGRKIQVLYEDARRQKPHVYQVFRIYLVLMEPEPLRACPAPSHRAERPPRSDLGMKNPAPVRTRGRGVGANNLCRRRTSGTDLRSAASSQRHASTPPQTMRQPVSDHVPTN